MIMILGIDEVGRGVWAGPLVVGAVVLGDAKIAGLTDSKALTAKRRQQLHDLIIDQAAAVSLGWVSAEEIDEIGLSAALKLATRRAVRPLKASYHEIIIDGTSNFLTGTPLESYVTVLKKADMLIPSVSAASIVAKVSRDRYMQSQDELFPGYGFSNHVGYGTAAHRQAIADLGVSPLHRLSIAPLAIYRQHQPAVTPLISNSTQPTTRQVADASETVVADLLKSKGHYLLDRNWRTRLCEIDIVSRYQDRLFFTEVKHRKNHQTSSGIDAVTAHKLRQMRFAAELYVHRFGLHDLDMQVAVASTSGQPPVVVDYLELS